MIKQTLDLTKKVGGATIKDVSTTERDGDLISVEMRFEDGRHWRIDPLAHKALYSEIFSSHNVERIRGGMEA